MAKKVGGEQQPVLFEIPAETSHLEPRGPFTAEGGRIKVATRDSQHHDPNAKNETPIIPPPPSLLKKPVSSIVKGD